MGPVPPGRLTGMRKRSVVCSAAEVILANGATGGQIWHGDEIRAVGSTRSGSRLLDSRINGEWRAGDDGVTFKTCQPCVTLLLTGSGSRCDRKESPKSRSERRLELCRKSTDLFPLRGLRGFCGSVCKSFPHLRECRRERYSYRRATWNRCNWPESPSRSRVFFVKLLCNPL